MCNELTLTCIETTCIETNLYRNDREPMMLFVKDARGLSKSTNKLDGVLLSCHPYLKLSLIIWSTHFPVSGL